MARSTVLLSISTRPAGQRVADCLGQLGLLADGLELCAESGLQVLDGWAASLLAGRAPCLRILATDVGLDGVKRLDLFQGLGGDRRGAGGGGQFVEAAAHV